MSKERAVAAVLAALEEFIANARQRASRLNRNRLSVMLVLTRKALEAYPLEEDAYITGGGGQVKGLSGGAVQKILESHGIERVFSSEGGRTSRGTINFARDYAELLNGFGDGPLGEASETTKQATFQAMEARLVELVQEHFAAQKLAIQVSPELSPTAMVAAILEAAKERQAEIPGSTALGAVAQHLVGAKLALRFPAVDVGNHPYTAADEQTARAGDFQVGDGVFHVTVAPGEPVLRKCAVNIGAGLRPVLIVPANKLAMAAGHAEELGIEGRLDIYDLERFVSANLSEMAGYSFAGVREGFARLIDAYNERLQAVETDHSLMIKLG